MRQIDQPWTTICTGSKSCRVWCMLVTPDMHFILFIHIDEIKVRRSFSRIVLAKRYIELEKTKAKKLRLLRQHSERQAPLSLRYISGQEDNHFPHAEKDIHRLEQLCHTMKTYRFYLRSVEQSFRLWLLSQWYSGLKAHLLAKLRALLLTKLTVTAHCYNLTNA